MANNVMVYLKGPKANGKRCIVHPWHSVSEGRQTHPPREKLDKLANALTPVNATGNGKVLRDHLLLEVVVHSVRLWRPTHERAWSRDADRPRFDDLKAELEVWEMDFGGDERKDVKLGEIEGRLKRKSKHEWEFEIGDDQYKLPPDEFVPCLRISTPSNKGYTWLPMPLDVVGHEKDQRWEIAVKLTVHLPGYEAGPNEPSEWERKAETLVFPRWWRTYKQGKSLRGLPFVKCNAKRKNVTLEMVKVPLNSYITKLRQWYEMQLSHRVTAINAFLLKDEKDKEKEIDKPADVDLFGLLVAGIEIATLIVPGSKALGVVAQFVGTVGGLKDVAVAPPKKTKGALDQFKDAYSTLASAVDPGKKVVDGVVYFLGGKAKARATTRPKAKVSYAEFGHQLYTAVQRMRSLFLGSTSEFYAAILKRAKEKEENQVLMRQLIVALREKAEQVEHHIRKKKGLRDFDRLVCDMVTEYMNANDFGIYTWLPPRPFPKEHAPEKFDIPLDMKAAAKFHRTFGTKHCSHVYARTTEQMTHIEKLLQRLKFQDREAERKGDFVLYPDARKKWLPNLKRYHAWHGAEHYVCHRSNKLHTSRKATYELDDDHYINVMLTKGRYISSTDRFDLDWDGSDGQSYNFNKKR